jgi:hypothetical protein
VAEATRAYDTSGFGTVKGCQDASVVCVCCGRERERERERERARERERENVLRVHGNPIESVTVRCGRSIYKDWWIMDFNLVLDNIRRSEN